MRRRLLRVAAPLAALLLAAGCAPRRQRQDSGPYVQAVTSSSAVVAAITEGERRLRLRYGEDGGPLLKQVEDPAPVQVHGLQAGSLSAATRYRYRLETLEGEPLGAGRFQTAPGDPSAPCTFFVLGDSGGTREARGAPLDSLSDEAEEALGEELDQNQQGQVARAMAGREVDLVLHTGDLVYPAGAREGYQEAFFRPFGALLAEVPFFPTLGNHDARTEGGAPFLETFFFPEGGPIPGRAIYSFDWGCVHFVCLDVVTTAYDPSSPQGAWLERDLQASRAPWKVVFFHFPPRSPTEPGDEGEVAGLGPRLEAAGVDLVLSGHDHCYGRFFPRGRTTYLVSGGGGRNLYSVQDADGLAYAESVYHFVEVVATPERLALRAIDASGQAFDATVIQK